MSVNPTSSKTKLIAAILVGVVLILGIVIGALVYSNTPKDMSFNSDICWNTVLDGEYWANGCKGSKNKDLMCTEALVKLTPEEKVEYQKWVNAGKPLIEGCD